MAILGIILALAVTAALICAWLAGNLFGRILALLVLAPVFAFGGAVLFAQIPDATVAACSLGALIGAAIAWPLASAPVYYARRHTGPLSVQLRDARF